MNLDTTRPSGSVNPAWILLAALLAVPIPSCAGKREEAPPVPVEKVKTVRVRKETIVPVLETFGTIVYRSKADVYAPFEAAVERIEAEEGDRVEGGRVLAVLARDKLGLSLEQAQAAEASKKALLVLAEEKLAEGRRSVEAKFLAADKARFEAEQKKADLEILAKVYGHKKKLFSVGGVSEGELENVKASYLRSRTDLDQAEKDLAIRLIGFRDRDIEEAGLATPKDEAERRGLFVELNTRMLAAERNVAASDYDAAVAERRRLELLLAEAEVRSPIAGVVGSRGIEPGEKATTETLLFSIFSAETVYAQADVAEKDLASVRPGLSAEVGIDGLPPMKGAVKLVSPSLDPRTKSARVKVLLDNRDGKLVPGMYARIAICLGSARSLPVVPESALVAEEGGKHSVFVLRGGILFKVPVTPGNRSGGKATVSEGLEEGERIAEKPLGTCRDGMKAEAVE